MVVSRVWFVVRGLWFVVSCFRCRVSGVGFPVSGFLFVAMCVACVACELRFLLLLVDYPFSLTDSGGKKTPRPRT